MPEEEKQLVKITINDKQLEAEEGTSILEVAIEAGIEIPTLCYHKELSAYGACRLCLVEVVAGGRPGLVASCVSKVSEGLAVKTDTEDVVKTRKIMLELLLARSPDSDQVKALAAKYGVTESRINLPEKSECVLCGLCARACAEVSQRYAINFANRGTERKVQTPFNKIALRCIGCGACAYVCPVGVIEVEQLD